MQQHDPHVFQGQGLDISLSATRIDYYRMLGLEPSAPVETVRDLYRVLARRLHPDVSGNPDTAAAMSLANRAYDALMPRPVPANFTIDATPALRRAREGNEALARYREVIGESPSPIGSLVDVLA
jgi:hypothetical protein